MDGETEKTRLHLVYLDTRHNPNQSDGSGSTAGLFDFYYAYSDDEGQTWTEARLTPNSTDVTHALEEENIFFGDYQGLAAFGKRVYIFFQVATNTGSAGYTEPYVIVFGDVPSYTDFDVIEGSLLSDDDLDLLTASDDDRVVVQDMTGSPTTPLQTIVDVELDTTYLDVDHDDEIDIRLECHADEPNVSGRIYLKSQPAASGEWVLWAQFEVNEDSDENSWRRAIPAIYLVGPASYDFVADDGRMDVRIEMTRAYSQGATLTSRIDYVQAVVVETDTD